MIYYKSEEEVELIKESGEILSRAHGEIAREVKPGVKTIQLDKIAEEYIMDNGGVPSFKDYNGFPYTLCISLNENVVHGFPSEVELKEGDIVSIDCGVFYKGFHSDCAYTYPIGEISKENMVKSIQLAKKVCTDIYEIQKKALKEKYSTLESSEKKGGAKK